MKFDVGNGPLTKACVGEAVRVGSVIGIAYGADPFYGLRVAIRDGDGWKHYDDVDWRAKDAEVLGIPKMGDVVHCGRCMGYAWADTVTVDVYNKLMADRERSAYTGEFTDASMLPR